LVICAIIDLNATIAISGGQTSILEEDGYEGSIYSWGISKEVATGANTVVSYDGDDYGVMGAMALVAAAAGGRTAMITRAKPLGVAAGMNFGVQY
jgi:hypothetical protein